MREERGLYVPVRMCVGLSPLTFHGAAEEALVLLGEGHACQSHRQRRWLDRRVVALAPLEQHDRGRDVLLVLLQGHRGRLANDVRVGGTRGRAVQVRVRLVLLQLEDHGLDQVVSAVRHGAKQLLLLLTQGDQRPDVLVGRIGGCHLDDRATVRHQLHHGHELQRGGHVVEGQHDGVYDGCLRRGGDVPRIRLSSSWHGGRSSWSGSSCRGASLA